MVKKNTAVPVAIIGIGCIFPKSPGLKEYWRLIFNAENAISDVPQTHWSADEYFDVDPATPDHTYCKRGGYLPAVTFDPTEFGIPPNALEATDSSQLLGLMAAKAALADAGYGDGRDFNREGTSVILGVTGTQELVIPLGARLGFPKWRKALDAAGVDSETTEDVIRKISDAYVSWQEGSFPGLLGNVVAGRICNRLDLRGTNCVVDAACASSLSAVHLALLEIASGRSDMVITGGVDTLNDIFMHMCFAKTRILSPTGDARPFSIDADGTVLGEGVGLVVLKRLADAEKDGDRIYAVIRGIGSSSDGKSQSIYAPRADGQAVALRRAYHHAGIDPATVELVETHGTGTRVGDAVEFDALCRVFSNGSARQRKCAIGSVKSMIGHTKAAAGAAGLIKGVLALHHKVLPPTLKADQPDPKLNIAHSPFYINTISRPWLTDGSHPRRCGVSAFGFGGSNFHIVLEEHQPKKTETAWDGSVEIIAFSASSKADLLQKMAAFQKDFDSGTSLSEAAARSRHAFSAKDEHRIAWAVDRLPDHDPDRQTNPSDFIAAELQHLSEHVDNSVAHRQGIYAGQGPSSGKIAFLFPGQGSQYPGMGRDLVCRFPEAFEAIEAASQQFDGGKRLFDAIYPSPATTREERQRQAYRLRRTDITQPALGAISLAMLNILTSFGIVPNATAGHSFGELTALHAAGWIDESTFLSLAATRGRLMAAADVDDAAPKSGMLAVSAPLGQLENLIGSQGLDVVLANRNSPHQGVIAGAIDALEAMASACRKKGYNSVMLPVAAAFHSHLVKKAQKPFQEVLETIRINPGAMPVFSNTTAESYPRDPARAVALLSRHLSQPVNFDLEIRNLFDFGIRTFVEVGPKNTLTGLVDDILAANNIRTLAMDTAKGSRTGISDLAHLLCQLAADGHPVELSRWETPIRQRRKPLMQIPLTGANYRNPATASLRPLNAALQGDRKPNRSKKHDMPGSPVSTRHEEHTLPPVQPNGKTDHVMKSSQPTPDNDLLKQALATIQQSLESMQTLQRQTAEAHQKFLDTQKEAGRTLQHMLEHSHRLTALSVGDRSSIVSPPTAQPERSTVVEPHISTATADLAAPPPTTGFPRPPEIHPKRTDIPVASPPRPVTSEPLSKPEPPSRPKALGGLQSTLLSVVSELTGYPADMIDPEMDIEADLGIDSIKRVEILSTLEERVPDMPAVAPDLIAKMKTLKQVAELLTHSESTGIPSPAGQSSADESGSEVDASPNERLHDSLLAVVSELTGYPIDMIGTDMDIEADLGIDSIKRVEILSALEEKMPGMPAVAPDQMGKLKTLRQIVDCLTSGTPIISAVEVDPAPAAPVSEEKQTQALPSEVAPLPSGPLSRRVVQVVEKEPGLGRPVVIPAGRKVYITEDGHGLAAAIADKLGKNDINTVLISPNILKYKDSLPPAAGLIVVLSPDNPLATDELTDIFHLTTRLSHELQASADQGGALFATISRLDGAFGFHGRGLAHPRQGALAGLVKTAALEWDGVHCRAFDVAPDWKDHDHAAVKLVDELLRDDPAGPIEIGLNKDRRCVLELVESPLVTVDPEEQVLAPGTVVVVTGGAKGVTAAASLALAEAMGLTLILLGRSPAPFPEPAWLKGLDTETDIKRAILKHDMSDGGSPVQLEKTFRKYMANREVETSLSAIERTGATVRYESVDICDGDAVRRVIKDIESAQGAITAVVHGAGILQDRLIEDKTPDQFRNVFDTKVLGLENLLAAVGSDNLRHLVLFSSIAGRTGNRGQADYAMANEALNKIAQKFSVDRPSCRVVSINWGPWDGGMVTASLKREFLRRGVTLIPIDLGARQLLAEMRAEGQRQVEVIVGGAGFGLVNGAPEIEPVQTDLKKRDSDELVLTFQRDVDLGTHPVLRSHVIDGKPVVPLALMTEWFGHGALHENPGLLLQGLDDIRVLKGIRLDSSKKHIRLMAGRARKSGDAFEVPVELRDGVQNNMEVIHSKARAILVDTLQSPPDYRIPEELTQNPYQRPMHQVYEEILFHGPELQGIQKITHLSTDGMIARIDPAPSPSKWLKEPLRNQWIADPLALDAAFQMATIWCYEEKGVVSLPSYCATYRQYRSRFPQDSLTAVLEVASAGSHKMTGVITFLDSDGHVVAQINGYEAIMDHALHKAFKPAAA